MTMRSVYYYACPNGHQGRKRVSENDQPYSASWESITLECMHDGPNDPNGKPTFLCDQCGQRMTSTPKPAV